MPDHRILDPESWILHPKTTGKPANRQTGPPGLGLLSSSYDLTSRSFGASTRQAG
ncbi:hypothetical protein D3OALGB2SA_189 [Olavius algarvensis associated proteobacterium Delta 3]|nr:hypothetical protein D3OALGB2SA_189 [Olavius algarvensis associated proteobacterium Delta 3]